MNPKFVKNNQYKKGKREEKSVFEIEETSSSEGSDKETAGRGKEFTTSKKENQNTETTVHLIKIVRLMISCDVVFPKAMAQNIPAFLGILIEKSLR